jgi:hypothetical protein
VLATKRKNWSSNACMGVRKSVACFLLLFVWVDLSAVWKIGAQTPADHTVAFENVLGLTFVEAVEEGAAVGRPLSLVLDTGASYNVLKPEVAAKLGLKPTGENIQTEGQGKGVDETLHFMQGASIRFAGETFADEPTATLPLDYIDREAGHPADGLLGSPVFRKYVLREDYKGNRVTLIRPDDFQAPQGFVAVPLQVAGTVSLLQLAMQTEAGTSVDGTFLLDSGQTVALMFMKPFVDAHPGLKSGRMLALPPVTAVGGEMQLNMGRLAGLKIGPFVLKSPAVVFPSSSPGGPASAALAGIVGAGVLRRFEVIFDYPHGKLWLKPNADFDQPFRANSSGLQLNVQPPNFHRVLVRGVIAGSPAAEAGVRPGDEILDYSHRPFRVASRVNHDESSLTLSTVSDWLKEPDRDLYLRLMRGTETRIVHFHTRDLV